MDILSGDKRRIGNLFYKGLTGLGILTAAACNQGEIIRSIQPEQNAKTSIDVLIKDNKQELPKKYLHVGPTIIRLASVPKPIPKYIMPHLEDHVLKSLNDQCYKKPSIENLKKIPFEKRSSAHLWNIYFAQGSLKAEDVQLLPRGEQESFLDVNLIRSEAEKYNLEPWLKKAVNTYMHSLTPDLFARSLKNSDEQYISRLRIAGTFFSRKNSNQRINKHKHLASAFISAATGISLYADNTEDLTIKRVSREEPTFKQLYRQGFLLPIEVFNGYIKLAASTPRHIAVETKNQGGFAYHFNKKRTVLNHDSNAIAKSMIFSQQAKAWYVSLYNKNKPVVKNILIPEDMNISINNNRVSVTNTRESTGHIEHGNKTTLENLVISTKKDKTTLNVNAKGTRYHMEMPQEGSARLIIEGAGFGVETTDPIAFWMTPSKKARQYIKHATLNHTGFILFYGDKDIKEMAKQNNRRFPLVQHKTLPKMMYELRDASMTLGIKYDPKSSEDSDTIKVSSEDRTVVHFADPKDPHNYVHQSGDDKVITGDTFLKKLLSNKLSKEDYAKEGARQISYLFKKAPLRQAELKVSTKKRNIVLLNTPDAEKEKQMHLITKIDNHAEIDTDKYSFKIKRGKVELNKGKGRAPQLKMGLDASEDAQIDMKHTLTASNKTVEGTTTFSASYDHKNKKEFVTETNHDEKLRRFAERYNVEINFAAAKLLRPRGDSTQLYQLFLKGRDAALCAKIKSDDFVTKFGLQGKIQFSPKLVVLNSDGYINIKSNKMDISAKVKNDAIYLGKKIRLVGGKANNVKASIDTPRGKISGVLPFDFTVSYDFSNKQLIYKAWNSFSKKIKRQLTLDELVFFPRYMQLNAAHDFDNDSQKIGVITQVYADGRHDLLSPEIKKFLQCKGKLKGNYTLNFLLREKPYGLKQLRLHVSGGDKDAIHTDNVVLSADLVKDGLTVKQKDRGNVGDTIECKGDLNLGPHIKTHLNNLLYLTRSAGTEEMSGSVDVTLKGLKINTPILKYRLNALNGTLSAHFSRSKDNRMKLHIKDKNLVFTSAGGQSLYNVGVNSLFTFRDLNDLTHNLKGCINATIESPSLGDLYVIKDLEFVYGHDHNKLVKLNGKILVGRDAIRIDNELKSLVGCLTIKSTTGNNNALETIIVDGQYDVTGLQGNVELSGNLQGVARLNNLLSGDIVVKQLALRKYLQNKGPTIAELRENKEKFLQKGINSQFLLRNIFISYDIQSPSKIIVSLPKGINNIEVGQVTNKEYEKIGQCTVKPITMQANIPKGLYHIDKIHFAFSTPYTSGEKEMNVRAKMNNVFYNLHKNKLSVGNFYGTFSSGYKSNKEIIMWLKSKPRGNSKVPLLVRQQASEGLAVELPRLHGNFEINIKKPWIGGKRHYQHRFPINDLELYFSDIFKTTKRYSLINEIGDPDFLAIMLGLIKGDLPEKFVERSAYVLQEVYGGAHVRKKEDDDFDINLTLQGKQGIDARIKGVKKTGVYQGADLGIVPMSMYPIKELFGFFLGEIGEKITTPIEFVGSMPNKVFDKIGIHTGHSMLDALIFANISVNAKLLPESHEKEEREQGEQTKTYLLCEQIDMPLHHEELYHLLRARESNKTLRNQYELLQSYRQRLMCGKKFKDFSNSEKRQCNEMYKQFRIRLPKSK